MPISRLYFINSTFPPQISGVGDHTAYLAAELAKIVEIKVLVGQGKLNSLPRIQVEQIFNTVKPQSFFSIIKFILSDMPDWVILQYDPFGYGTSYGLNPYIPLVINILKRLCPQVRIGVIVHESFVQIRNWKSAVLSTCLKTQLWVILSATDVIFTVIEPWKPILTNWFPNKLVQHLPVSSNIPYLSAYKNEVRASLGISPTTIILGLFGRIQRVHSLQHIIKAVNQTIAAGFEVVVLYVGLDPVGAKTCLSDVPLLAEGPLPPEEVSRRFAAMDIYLVPIDEGVSTRRTSLMAGLQHGIPTVATVGPVTDSMLIREHGKALLLADVKAPDDFASAVIELASNPLQRKLLSDGAKELFSREFTWNQVSSKLLTTLESFPIDRGNK